MDNAHSHNTRSKSQWTKGLRQLEETIDRVARGVEGANYPRRDDPHSEADRGETSSALDSEGGSSGSPLKINSTKKRSVTRLLSVKLKNWDYEIYLFANYLFLVN